MCVYTLHLPNAIDQWCQWWQKHVSSVKQCNKLLINMQCKIGIQYQCQTRSDPWPTSRIGDVPGPPGPKDKLSIACCTAPTWGNLLCTPQYPLGESHPWSFHWTSWPSWQSRKRVLGSETNTGIHAKNHRELAHQWLIPTKNHNKCTSISPACSNRNYFFCIYNSWLTQSRNNNRHNLATNVKLAKSPGIWQTIGNSMQWGQIYGRQYKNWPYWLTDTNSYYWTSPGRPMEGCPYSMHALFPKIGEPPTWGERKTRENTQHFKTFTHFHGNREGLSIHAFFLVKPRFVPRCSRDLHVVADVKSEPPRASPAPSTSQFAKGWLQAFSSAVVKPGPWISPAIVGPNEEPRMLCNVGSFLDLFGIFRIRGRDPQFKVVGTIPLPSSMVMLLDVAICG